MKSGVTPLYPNDKVAERVTDYSASHSTPLPKYITDFHASVSKNHKSSFYLTSNFQSQYHVTLARLIGAKRVLEIGVFVGYSAMVWSHAIGPDGHVTGLEFSPEFAKEAEDAFAANGVKNVEVVVGAASETLPTLKPSEPYDLIFIDADKEGYPGYLAQILAQSAPGSASRLLRPGGVIIADNVLRRGIVADDSTDNPYVAEQTEKRTAAGLESGLKGLRDFNSALVSSERIEAFLLPLYDGVGIGRLID
ncbi:related to caffeoyl-coa o-methyltransferase [Cephalotrichum gorgonifer]|uniref:Related to caffeoyl-coa o-methyltransferase n=1 Tax=Cephalotrichum gorgonifer TaxID=2041049 RepID=A0AAE8MPF5_9PEZI|nr:related to caffeoyl-coa o-methyltransferase [Cephalotrichum gorgonifer]